MPTAEILSQGDEVVTGQIADTNAAWLATQLTDLGFSILRHTTVGDRLDDISKEIARAHTSASLVLCTGGLGPTEDDLTAQAVSQVFSRPLEMDETALHTIEGHYQRLNRAMPAVNRKQAMLPTGTKRLDNAWGTAPGFALHQANALLIFLPGVPREMKPMFAERVLPLLREQFSLSPGRLVTLKTTGVGESTLQERIGSFEHPGVVLSYRARTPENHIKLRFGPDLTEDEVKAVTQRVAHDIGTPLFCNEGIGQAEGSLAAIVGQMLHDTDSTVAVAESCTGGRICSEFTSIAGSSRWFLEGAVTYSNEAKFRQLGVKKSTLEAHGAVSEAVCREMAEGIRMRTGATYGLATTGIAGPSGGTSEKRVGTVHISLSTPDSYYHRQLNLPGDRQRNQLWSSSACIDLLRRFLQGYLPTTS